MSEAPIHGVVLSDLQTHTDVRGGFTELFRASRFPSSMAQLNLSFSRTGVLRGMHFHRRQADYWCPVQGRAFVALFDLRLGSPTQRVVNTFLFDAAEGLRGLLIPAGVAHGFCALSELRLLYLVDAEYTGDDEFGFAWNDPELGIGWPVSEPLVSDRDSRADPLATVLSDPPRFEG